jgi:ATP-dependent DNA helicase RecG
MLDMIENSMYKYIDIATETIIVDGDVGVNDGVNVGVKNVILDNLQKFPTLSAKKLSDKLGLSPRQIERHISELKAEGKLLRVGAAKNGHWEVIEQTKI